MITQKNIAEILDLLAAAYGEKAFPENPAQMARVIKLWQVMFQDDDPVEVLTAVKSCIATLSFPPKIADIKTRIAESRMAGQMTEMEAWAKIRDAVFESRTSRDANRTYTALPRILQKCVGSPSQLCAWGNVSKDTFEGVIASNFQRSYRELAKREAVYNALPKDLQRSQSWMIAPPETKLLPELANKSVEEIEAELDADTQQFRDRQGIEAKQEYGGGVADFKKPLTENEVKMFRAREKHKDDLRIEKIKAEVKGR